MRIKVYARLLNCVLTMSAYSQVIIPYLKTLILPDEMKAGLEKGNKEDAKVMMMT